MTETPDQIAERLLPQAHSVTIKVGAGQSVYGDAATWNAAMLSARPAVAAALQSERDSWDSWDSLQAENERLRAELLKAGRALSVGGCKWKFGCLRPKAWEHMPETAPELAAELDDMAQAALATLGEE